MVGCGRQKLESHLDLAVNSRNHGVVGRSKNTLEHDLHLVVHSHTCDNKNVKHDHSNVSPAVSFRACITGTFTLVSGDIITCTLTAGPIA